MNGPSGKPPPPVEVRHSQVHGLGVFATVVAEITLVAFTASSGGLGAMSAGFSETFLFGLPVAIILSVVVGRRARRRVRRPALVPVALATASALLGAAWVMATASSSFA